MVPTSLPEPLPLVRSLVEEGTTAAFEDALAGLTGMVGRLEDLAGPGRRLLAGGKRTRALLAFAGHLAAGGTDRPDRDHPVITAGAALELFQLAALVHDDVMDAADTRRGLPAAHRAYAAAHRRGNLAGDADAFGVAGAILLGDLLLATSSERMEHARATAAPSAGVAARAVYDHMCAEVAAGQYLDVRAAATPLDVDPDGALDRALTVLRHKSARYSVEHPLALGAALAGGDDALVAALRDVGGPLGTAFQLRDDELGVFGDPLVTGKPAGDDLREGKRTALLALTWSAAGPAQRTELKRLVGDPALDDDGVARLREIIRDRGAAAEHEALIEAHERDAHRALTDLPVTEDVRALLSALGRTLVTRTA